jgi:hypothetical protein
VRDGRGLPLKLIAALAFGVAAAAGVALLAVLRADQRLMGREVG